MLQELPLLPVGFKPMPEKALRLWKLTTIPLKTGQAEVVPLLRLMSIRLVLRMLQKTILSGILTVMER